MANLIRLKQIESSSYLEAAGQIGEDFSGSVYEIIDGAGLISSSTQLDGTTLRNITIAPIDADSYSLVISGAMAVVDANNLTGSIDGDDDTSVPAQIYMVSGSIAPLDPYVSGSQQSNIIDQGEW